MVAPRRVLDDARLQSLPFARLADRILAHAKPAGGGARDEGSVLGGLGRMFEQRD